MPVWSFVDFWVISSMTNDRGMVACMVGWVGGWVGGAAFGGCRW